MGQLDQIAKLLFAEETEAVTGGAMAWVPPPEIGLIEVRLDGLLVVRAPSLLVDLASPWAEARDHREIVLEIKMPGDHLDAIPIERAMLRRQAWQVQRLEEPDTTWRGQTPIWIAAPRKPAALARDRAVTRIAPGCYRVGPSTFDFLWIAANELPLRDDLIPFLMVRSGCALDRFARWVAPRRPPAWVLRMVQILPMSTAARADLSQYIVHSDDPGIRARQRHLTRILLDAQPDVRNKLIAKGRKQGLEQGLDQGVEQGLAPVAHMFERRLKRPLTEGEHHVLRERLRLLGPDRLGDVVLDLAPRALATWLANPTAT